MSAADPDIAARPAPPSRAASRAVLLLGAVVLVQLLMMAGLWEQFTAHSKHADLPPPVETAHAGDALPDFPVRLAGGQALERPALLAQAPLLVFVASAGCNACEERRALLVKAQQPGALAAGMTVLVLGDGTADWVTEFCRGTDWLPAVDPGGRAGRLLTGGLVPFFALVDETGVIRAASLAGFDHDFLHALEHSRAADAVPHDEPHTQQTTQGGG